MRAKLVARHARRSLIRVKMDRRSLPVIGIGSLCILQHVPCTMPTFLFTVSSPTETFLVRITSNSIIRSHISSMNRLYILFFCASLLPLVDGFFILPLVYRILSNLFLNTACRQALLRLDSFPNCDCAIKRRSGSVTADFSCSIGPAKCLVDSNVFCVQGDYDGTIDLGLTGLVGLSSNINGCFDLSGPPPELSDLGKFDELCVSVDPTFSGGLSDCSVTIGGEDCVTCNVCPSGKDITFSCANVDIGGSYPAFVAGPVVSNCTGLTLAPA